MATGLDDGGLRTPIAQHARYKLTKTHLQDPHAHAWLI